MAKAKTTRKSKPRGPAEDQILAMSEHYFVDFTAKLWGNPALISVVRISDGHAKTLPVEALDSVNFILSRFKPDEAATLIERLTDAKWRSFYKPSGAKEIAGNARAGSAGS